MRKKVLSFFSIIFATFLLVSCFAKSFEVDFDLQGGTLEVESQTVTENGLVDKPGDPTKEGFTFLYWSNDKGEDAVEWDFLTDTVDKDLTLYALWLVNEFEVNFNVDGGSPKPEAQTIELDNLVNKPADPEKEGFTFLYWSKDTGENAVEWDFSNNKVNKNLTLNAIWSINNYLVNFDTDGGAPEPDAQKVTYGEKALEPQVLPEADGHLFLGWFLDGELFDFDAPITQDITIKAQWGVAYSVTFDPLNDRDDAFVRIVLENSKALKPLNPGKQGFVFAGWFYDDNGEDVLWDFDTLITEDVQLFAKYNTAEEHVNQDFDAINLEIVDGKIDFPQRGPVNNIRLNWKSNDTFVITNKGIVIPPSKSAGDKTVTIVASSTYAGETYLREYEVFVEARKEVVVTNEKEIDFTNLTNEYDVLDSSITAFFVDDGNLPYLDVESFLMLLDGLLYGEELNFTSNEYLLNISYEVTDEDEETTYFYEAIVDFDEKTVFVEYMSFFSNYIQSTATDYSEGINYIDFYVEPGSSVLFELAKYNVEMIVYEVGDEVYYLMPYNFLSTIFMSETYYNFYYNGDDFYGFYSIPSPNDEKDDYHTYETIKTSSYNNTEIPLDIALATFNQTAFIFDHYFGLRYKDDYNIEESFYETLVNNIDNYLGTVDNFNNAIRTFVLKYLDEMHSSYRFPGYYNRPGFNFSLYFDDLGPKVQSWYEEGVWPIQAAIDYWHYDDREGFKFLDDEKETALIYLDGFVTASVDDEKSAENDSDAFMRETLEAIYAENPNVKNIGIDLSYNTGGNIGALLRVLGFITEKPIEMSYHNPLTGQNQTSFIALDQEAYEDVNWFFITSPVTFSAANLMTAIVKNQELGLIIGSTSGGGAASITPFVLGEGTMISISSNSLISIRTDNGDGTYTYTDVEDGIEPDLYLAPKDTQNPSKILDLLNQYYN